MKSSYLDFFAKYKIFSELSDAAGKLSEEENLLKVSRLPRSFRSIFISRLSRTETAILVLAESSKDVHEIHVEIDLLGLGARCVVIDSFTLSALQEKLTEISHKEQAIIISTYRILTAVLPQPAELQKSTTKVETGGEIEYDELIEYLSMLNYNREKYVGAPGDFAVRGSIIDFWSYSENQPCRIEYDGDFIESIRYFDSENQRSHGRVESVTLAASIEESEQQEESDIFEYLFNAVVFASEIELENLFSAKRESEVSAPTEIEEDIDDDLKKELYENGGEKEPEIDIPELNELNNLTIESILHKPVRWIIEDQLGSDSSSLYTGLTDAPAVNSSFEILFQQLLKYSEAGFRILITSENEMQARRLSELLSEFKSELAALIDTGVIKIVVLPIKEGFIIKEEKFALFTDYQIFNKPYRTKIVSKKRRKSIRSKDFASIKRGDYVVHENFGIGRYEGLETIRIGQIEQESIKIQYAEGGVVYVNLNFLGLVKKFSSKENAAPRLSVLGSGEWRRTKKKVKGKIKEAARDLIALYAKRKSTPGIKYSPDSVWQKELEASFFYEDTPDQAKAAELVKSDMESENPMDRLVCGDVGFGKTEVAVRAAFKAVQDGKQVGLLVPTTILAEQHFNTFQDRLSQFPVKVAVISRFQTKSQQTMILQNVAKGSVDVLIGTHRLLSKDVKFNDLGLLIIDEEHRFGVMAKEKLRQFRVNVDTLTLTATPIPRTLNLSLLGARDLSIIATPPPNRQPIYTKVERFEIQKVRQWVLDELRRGGQVYFVHDRVQSINKIANYIKKHIPELRIGIAHGQMKPADLENVIHDFLNKKFDMLISTKIIESGIDIPNVNTIIINRADRFGLAELHQLRGRVGRSDRQAYAYLLVPSLATMTKKAVRRLQAIEEYTDLGEGFNLSMRDLEIRGAGNLLGTEQSGAINSVGFDLYVKMLDEAVLELKQEEFQEVFKELPKHAERSEPTIDTYFEIGIPESYMPDQADRLSFYTALFTMLKLEEVDEIKEEMTDKFGKIPPIIDLLIKTAILRYHASFALLERIVIRKDKIALILPKAEREDFYTNKFSELMQYIMQKYYKTVHFVQGKESMKLEMKNQFSTPDEVLDYITSFCKEITEKVIQEKKSAVNA